MKTQHYCKANNDGSCTWAECPQIRDGEPERSGRPCPIGSEREIAARPAVEASPFGPNWHDDRCGHNFVIRNCPYKNCEAKLATIELDEARAMVAQLTAELNDWADNNLKTPCRLDPEDRCATILACHSVCKKYEGHEELSPLVRNSGTYQGSLIADDAAAATRTLLERWFLSPPRSSANLPGRSTVLTPPGEELVRAVARLLREYGERLAGNVPASLSVDVMERAQQALKEASIAYGLEVVKLHNARGAYLEFTSHGYDTSQSIRIDISPVAHALTEYGDQRAREARAEYVEESKRLRENAVAAARAAAIEEADWLVCQEVINGDAHTAEILRARIRALAEPKP